ncbi:hypothetical protein ALC56_04572 [Trachymyrmex septentrionalis]|uniref:Uncharacterized protein n=1 Tax=Trachymyrmex septentrionalis TaxID=34720 RepID=A0A195FLW3_9HYME|nr:hypothetical protein ALC56_04572 [Trachymyrmex septentrionalis]
MSATLNEEEFNASEVGRQGRLELIISTEMRFRLSFANMREHIQINLTCMFGNDRESRKITNSSTCLTAAMDLHFTIRNSAATFPL